MQLVTFLCVQWLLLLQADCRCQLGEAFAAGLLGSPRIQEPGSAALTFLRTMLGYLLSGVEPALAALRTGAPTHAAIEAATSAITDIMSVLVRATDFAAQVGTRWTPSLCVSHSRDLHM